MGVMKAWKRKPRRTDLVLATATVVGLGMLVYALGLTAEPQDWAAGVLVNLGSAVLLVIPIYLLNRGLDRRIESAQVETASQVKALTDRVSTFEEDVERRLDDVVASVSTRLAEERKQDQVAFDELLRTPSRRAIEAALQRAHHLGLIIPERGPRVCVSNAWDLYVRIDFDDQNVHRTRGGWSTYKGELIEFMVETASGKTLDIIPWLEDQAVDDVMVRVGRALERGGSSNDFNVERFFQGLREAFVVAASHPARRPIWQVCPPQWAVTSRSIVTYSDAEPLSVSFDALEDNAYWSMVLEPRHLAGDPKIDLTSYEAARVAARALGGGELASIRMKAPF